MKRVAFASHVALIEGKEYDGIGNVMTKTLSTIAPKFTFVRHSMEGLLPSEIKSYHNSRIVQTIDLRVLSRIAPIRYITEIVKTVYYFSRKEKVDIYIGIDPLNALAGIILKKLKRVNTAIFYTADYSPNRFNRKLMNATYHWIDVYCVKNADEVWSVSSKIVGIRKSMGLADAKNIFLPNVPPVGYDYLIKNEHDKFKLITYGIIDTQLDFEGAIRAVAKLADEMPDISFTIVGNGPEEGRLKKLVVGLGVTDRVHFMGQLPLGETLMLASKSGIGLALYTGAWGFNEFGDSTKCREYFNFGLPVISTGTHSTVEEIKEYGAGQIVKVGVNEYVSSIRNIIGDYDTYALGSKKLGNLYSGAHKKEVTRILDLCHKAPVLRQETTS